jgi:hypothetical protein
MENANTWVKSEERGMGILILNFIFSYYHGKGDLLPYVMLFKEKTYYHVWIDDYYHGLT